MRRGRWLLFALSTVLVAAAAEACGAFATTNETSSGGPETSVGPEGSIDGSAIEASADGSELDSGCRVLLDHGFDTLSPFGSTKLVGDGSTIGIDIGELVAFVPALQGNAEGEAHVHHDLEDAGGTIELTFRVTDVTDNPTNWANTVLGCAVVVDPKGSAAEVRMRLQNNQLKFEALGSPPTLDIIAPPADPTAMTFRIQLKYVGNEVEGRLSIDGGPYSAPVKRGVQSTTLRVKCGIDFAQSAATAPTSPLRRSVDFVKVVRCPP